MTNTGPVVPEDQIARLLEPFQRIAPTRTGQHEGSGLGLSIVQAIAKAHSGRLVVIPGREGGLTVEIRFPARPFPGHRYALRPADQARVPAEWTTRPPTTVSSERIKGMRSAGTVK